MIALWVSRGWWSVAIAESLICEANAAASDAILLENFDPDYLVFERARQLRQAGVALRVLVPVSAAADDGNPNPVPLKITELMAELARLGPIEVIPVREVEPISLNVARDILRFIQRDRIRSMVVVTPAFRSRRSVLVYTSMLSPAGISVTCEPVRGTRGVGTWTETWHGVQTVAEQWTKLFYYRWYVLPFRRGS